MTKVRGSISFWIEYGALDDDDPQKAEVRELAFELVEEGIHHPTFQANRWPLGTGMVDGFSVDLPSRTGFIACTTFRDEEGDRYIAMLWLIWNPGAEPNVWGDYPTGP